VIFIKPSITAFVTSNQTISKSTSPLPLPTLTYSAPKKEEPLTHLTKIYKMDFVNLANDVSQITETLLRHLSLQEYNAGDFAPASTKRALQYNPEGDMTAVPISTPFLSPTAEGELYLVATNFLLCEWPQ
jgi:hypothetical protein